MCGFAGFLSNKLSVLGSLDATATQMTKAIAHRGPDDSGAWADAQAGIALGFRRLAIIDLSPAGHQPMVSSAGCPLMLTGGMLGTSKSACQPDFLGRTASLLRAKPTEELASGAWVVLGWNRHKIQWQKR